MVPGLYSYLREATTARAWLLFSTPYCGLVTMEQQSLSIRFTGGSCSGLSFQKDDRAVRLHLLLGGSVIDIVLLIITNNM